MFLGIRFSKIHSFSVISVFITYAVVHVFTFLSNVISLFAYMYIILLITALVYVFVNILWKINANGLSKSAR